MAQKHSLDRPVAFLRKRHLQDGARARELPHVGWSGDFIVDFADFEQRMRPRNSILHRNVNLQDRGTSMEVFQLEEQDETGCQGLRGWDLINDQ